MGALYEVRSPLKHARRRYEPGEEIVLEDEAAGPLLESGVIAWLSEGERRPAGTSAAGSDGEGESGAKGGESKRPAGSGANPDSGAEAAGRAAVLREAIAALGPEAREPEQWTRSGKPEVRALEAASGLGGVSAAERDAAWAAYQGEKGEGE